MASPSRASELPANGYIRQATATARDNSIFICDFMAAGGGGEISRAVEAFTTPHSVGRFGGYLTTKCQRSWRTCEDGQRWQHGPWNSRS
jgi:hypothetical protein